MNSCLYFSLRISNSFGFLNYIFNGNYIILDTDYFVFIKSTVLNVFNI